MSVLHINNITNKEGTGGPTIAGITTVDSTGFMKVPVGDTRTRLVNDYENIVTDGLVLHLDAGRAESFGGDGTTWRDLSGNNNNGTLVNGVGFSAEDGGSLEFDGVNDRVVVPTNDGFGQINSSPTISLEMWANLNRKSGGGTQFQQVAGFRTAKFEFFFLLLDLSGSSVSTEARITTKNTYYDINVNYTTFFNSWTHIVFTANSNRTDLYLNGSLVGSNTNVSGEFGATSGNFIIGMHPDNIEFPTKGNIGSTKVYNRALTAQEVLQNYNALKGRYI